VSATIIFALVSIAIGGVAIAVQAPINATLARHMGDPFAAAAVSFGIGFLVLAVIATLRGSWPPLGALRAVPWWAWSGGALGTVYVTAAIWSVPRIGAVTLVAALILGQMLAALMLDATGAFGLAAREITPARIGATLMVVGGILLSRM
jgi:transporter family-2 protein